MKKNLEYSLMAKYYDVFYQNKRYDKEVDFIVDVLKDKRCDILDAGCGTGTHATILHKKGFNVWGFDLNEEMVKIANKKAKGMFEVGNLLTYKTDMRFDVIMSFFAVFNHLRNYKDFGRALMNLKKLLNENGMLIIDLHNPQKDGTKTEVVGDVQRTMKWRINRLVNKEFSKLEYIVDGKKISTKHTFKIFKVTRLIKLCKALGFKSCKVYENYDISKTATKQSKNIQLVIEI